MDWVQSVFGFLQNQSIAIGAGLVVGIIYKFFPLFKKYSNEIIPLLAAVVAWLTNVFAPPAQAGVLGDVWHGFGGIFVPIADAAIAKFVHELILRGAFTAFGWKKPQ